MEAVGNIKKITKAMKMVASAKLKRCEEALKMTRAFTAGIADLWGPEEPAVKEGHDPNKIPAAAPSSQAAEPAADGGKAVVPNSVMVLAITPDRGLCGSVSATVFRATRNRVNALHAAGKTVMLLVYGEKARAGLERNFSSDFTASVTEHTKLKRRSFKQSAMMANLLLQQPFEQAEVFYNTFKNMISFETRHMRLLSSQQAVSDNAKLLEPYEVEGEAETMDNLYQFSLAVRLHGWLAESDMVEFSQRVNSMGNSSKSAEDMLSRLRLIYNRSRQSKITTELVEIISGAAAADDSKAEEQ